VPVAGQEPPKKERGLGGLVIGGMVGLDIFFLAFISGASMNPARSYAPALLSGVLGNLWHYWTATFIGSATIAFLVRKKFKSSKMV
jgi:aquaporin Z